jgi:hypothetical protein
MSRSDQQQPTIASPAVTAEGRVHSIDWYAPGQSRVFEIANVRIVIRLVDRKGRRARVAVQVNTDDQSAL